MNNYIKIPVIAITALSVLGGPVAVIAQDKPKAPAAASANEEVINLAVSGMV